jgi:arylsulfatase A-like enzyme
VKLTSLITLLSSMLFASPAAAADKPNIIFILADDLGYGDLGCYGQKRIETPCIDRLAAEGIRFTQCYAGSTVCAPSRCCLMTGLNTGHAWIRGNARVPLRPQDVTVAEVLKHAGYTTALVGKWGLGNENTTGMPTRQGFDLFYGYLDQMHAHDYYPEHLWRNESPERIATYQVRHGIALRTTPYTHDLFTREALAFIEQHKDGPFFLYLAYTIPHANNERGRAEGNGMDVPSDEPYGDRDWPQPQKNHAAMITRMDRDIGRLIDRLRNLGIAERTIVFFSSDNGPHKEGGADPAFFGSSGPLRGFKRDLYEGGIRVPGIVWWPGHVAAGVVSDYAWAFWDFLPTAAELAAVPAPSDLDGVSIVPTLLGADRAGREQPAHDCFYWEFHERGFKQAARCGNFKAVRLGKGKPLELYDLTTDLGEQHNIADEHPDVVQDMEKVLDRARTENPHWKVK